MQKIAQLEEELKTNIDGLGALLEEGLLNDQEHTEKKEQAHKTHQHSLDKIDAEIDHEWEQNGDAILKKYVCKEKCDLLKGSYTNKLLTKEEFEQKKHDLVKDARDNITNTIKEFESAEPEVKGSIYGHHLPKQRSANKSSIPVRHYINNNTGFFEGKFINRNLIEVKVLPDGSHKVRVFIWPIVCIEKITHREVKGARW